MEEKGYVQYKGQLLDILPLATPLLEQQLKLLDV